MGDDVADGDRFPINVGGGCEVVCELHGKEGQANGSQVQSPWPCGNAREQIALVRLPVVE